MQEPSHESTTDEVMSALLLHLHGLHTVQPKQQISTFTCKWTRRDTGCAGRRGGPEREAGLISMMVDGTHICTHHGHTDPLLPYFCLIIIIRSVIFRVCCPPVLSVLRMSFFSSSEFTAALLPHITSQYRCNDTFVPSMWFQKCRLSC